MLFAWLWKTKETPNKQKLINGEPILGKDRSGFGPMSVALDLSQPESTKLEPVQLPKQQAWKMLDGYGICWFVSNVTLGSFWFPEKQKTQQKVHLKKQTRLLR